MKEDILTLIASRVSVEMFKELAPQLEILLWKLSGSWPPDIRALLPLPSLRPRAVWKTRCACHSPQACAAVLVWGHRFLFF